MLIFNRDPLRASVEAATGGRVTVMYDDKGYPSYMHVFAKQDVAGLDEDLGTGVHPAFLVNGVEKSEIFIGQYKANVLDGRALSLPGYGPTVNVNFDAAKGYCTAKGPGWHMMTNWEAAALALYCIKNGQPHGNTDLGRYHAAHHEVGRRQDGGVPGVSPGGMTLNGSGPASWRHDGTMAGIDGLCGNVNEWIDGMKIVNGKFFFPDDNDFTLAEANWKDQGVIIANDSGAKKLGAAGTDTLYDTGGTYSAVSPWRSMDKTANYDALDAVVKRRFMQAMIDPAFNTTDPVGYFIFHTDGERLPFRFGYWSNGADAGVACLGLRYGRTGTGANLGFRPAYVS